jgi:DNA topoisomerase I
MKQKKKLTRHQLLRTASDHQKAASAVNLVYITSSTAGIQRVKKGKNYSYIYKGKKVKDAATLERIKKLAIPPSWTDAWICASPNGHIQATGIDMLGRKQYRYHASWNELRSETKFHRLYEFGKVLPQLRRLAKKDIAGKELSDKKVIATVINLMEETYIRIGNNDYEKKYGSYGLTTLKDRHVSIKKDNIQFCFTGKKGIEHTITVKNKRLARLVKQCRDIPGKELFQYYTAEGERRSVDSGMVNGYLREASGGMEVSAKDFRTWAGSLKAIECLTKAGETETKKDTQQTIVSMLDEVSEKLGNTRTICKKYYVHPGIIKLYEEGKLVSLVNNAMTRKPLRGLNKEETALMTALKKCC